MDEKLTFSATKLAAMIKSGQITSAQAVDSHIERIQAVNPKLNAMVKDRFDQARKEAKKADALIKGGKKKTLPPLLGVPCTIKECFSLTGMPNASGLVARKDVISDTDAPTVARIRKAGAIPMGVTNTSELCMWMETNNNVYGRTNNPYDQTRIVGGSSGGEGAIIGAGGSPFGLGSDIGGSIRMPAFFNGIFGHKPSSGLVPGTGQHPVAAGVALRYLTTGPLARRAEDLWPLLQILAGPDGVDTACRPMDLGDPDTVDISKLNVLVVDGNGKIGVSKDMIEALHKSAGALDQMGAKVQTAKFDGLKDSLDIWSAMLSKGDGLSFSQMLGQGTEISETGELVKWALRKSPHTLPAIILAMVEKMPKKFVERTERFIEKGRQLRKEMTERMGENGILLYPSYSRPAPKHNVPMALAFHWVYTGIFNVMLFPVTQVPLGLNAAGLPLGVQVAAMHGNDHITIAVAKALEEKFGGWVPPVNL